MLGMSWIGQMRKKIRLGQVVSGRETGGLIIILDPLNGALIKKNLGKNQCFGFK